MGSMCENVATSLGDQGVVFHIASFEHSFYLVLFLATSLSLVLHLSMYLSLDFSESFTMKLDAWCWSKA